MTRSYGRSASGRASRIFREFVAGISPKAMAKRLNAEGVPGPAGAAWSPSTGKRVARPISPSVWIEKAAPELRIVDDERWRDGKGRLLLMLVAPMRCGGLR